MNRKLASALMAFILMGVFLSAINYSPNSKITAFGQVGTSVGGILLENTTWTKANSPYNLTGNILVNNGVTLTIEAGATVNLNSYYIMVNGSLRVEGSSTDKIYFNGGENGAHINFTQYSRGWENQTDFGSIIEYAIFNQIMVTSPKPLKITNIFLNGEITVGDYSSITNNVILGRAYTSSNPYAITTGQSSSISDNIINGTEYHFSFLGYVYRCLAINAGESSLLSNNVVRGNIDGDSITVTNNDITGKISGISMVVSSNNITGPESITVVSEGMHNSISAIYSIGDSSTIINNTIHYTTTKYSSSYYNTAYGITIQSGFAYISGNVISDTLTGIRVACDSIIEENFVTNSNNGIEFGTIHFSDFTYGAGDVVIQNNTLANNGKGLVSIRTGGSATIENNIIYNNTNGINVVSQTTIMKNIIFNNLNGIITGSQGTIQNNTISNNAIGIKITNTSSTIAYNNIQYSSIYHLQLDMPVQNGFDAPNNWWGTTNTSIIDQHIYDYYDDFNLGKVTYLPFLSQSNPNAPTIQFYNFNVSVETNNFNVTATSNSIISELMFNQTLKELKFNVQGLTGKTGFCSITIPADLMSGTFSIFRDDILLVKNVDYTETYNGTHYMFQIFYNHSSHTIQIVSSQVIPEFPSNLLMVLILMFLSASALVSRKRLLKSHN